MPTEVQAQCFADRSALIAALARRIGQALTSHQGRGGASVMLSGGNTPLPAYRALAAQGVKPAAGLTLLYSDDRYVPSTSEASNYHQTLPLLEALALPEAQVLRVRTELPLAEAADDYDRRVAELSQRGAPIRLGLLGLGEDGHAASLFTPDDLARAQGRCAIAVHRPDGRDAVSVTPQVLASITQLIFVVAGAEKRGVLAMLLERDPGLTAWQAVAGRASVEVWTEREAWPQAAVPRPAADASRGGGGAA
ncbi:MAG TPA: 6-phosphogluconolactonase [Steroidobacteraceae bacterium]|nr:6-phosphogluconolactonase [Steroidobacteraceae bacterium]